MSITLTVARSAEEADTVYRLRYQVYVEEEGHFTRAQFPDGKIRDVFDGTAVNKNIIIYCNGTPAGTVRYTLDSTVGLPADHLFDFSPQRRLLPGPYAGVGMLAVLQEYRRMPVFFSLIKLIGEIAVGDRVKWLFFPLNAEVEALMRRFGGVRVGPRFQSDKVRAEIVPMRIDVSQIWAKYKSLFEVMDKFRLSDTYQREVFRKGDIIIRKGDPAADVYYIARGQVQVTASDFAKSPEDGPVILKEGSYIGELGVINRAVRSANVIADDVEVEVVVIPGSAFMGELKVHPELMQDFFQLMFKRTGVYKTVFH